MSLCGASVSVFVKVRPAFGRGELRPVAVERGDGRLGHAVGRSFTS